MISRLPRLILPKDTTPSISQTTAGLDGLRASNNSVIRGKPPVISPDLADLRGILTKILPALIFSPSFTIKCAPTGKLYVFSSPSIVITLKPGTNFLLRDSEITFSWKPVCSSISIWKVIPCSNCSYSILPVDSAMITPL